MAPMSAFGILRIGKKFRNLAGISKKRVPDVKFPFDCALG